MVYRVRIEAPIRPTEDPAKVETAVRRLFPDASPRREGAWVRAETESIDTLLKKAGEERVQDAARGTLWRGRLDERSTRFELNKQAAFMGRVNFNEVTHPLGDLVVTIETDSLEALLDRISPPTAAEIAHKDRATVKKRAELKREEASLAAIGSGIDRGDLWEDEEDLDVADDAEEE